MMRMAVYYTTPPPSPRFPAAVARGNIHAEAHLHQPVPEDGTPPEELRLLRADGLEVVQELREHMKIARDVHRMKPRIDLDAPHGRNRVGITMHEEYGARTGIELELGKQDVLVAVPAVGVRPVRAVRKDIRRIGGHREGDVAGQGVNLVNRLVNACLRRKRHQQGEVTGGGI